ncbi:hypothetical protein [Amycolatopsis benzoatilytica]|uniref:hypothetical protein n=1 Tax=Amycolatopsis benzoatilytica TaxID=346045 RepID=UPI001B7F9658|nr:hypothetical protein [Amycolatopsis benzoatilytica]
MTRESAAAAAPSRRAPASKAVGGLAMAAFLPIMVLGGVHLPDPLLPAVIQKIGAYLPPGTQPLQDA